MNTTYPGAYSAETGGENNVQLFFFTAIWSALVSVDVRTVPAHQIESPIFESQMFSSKYIIM